MNTNTKTYLESLSETLKSSDSVNQAYKKVGSKLILFCSSNSKTELNTLINDKLVELASESVKTIIIISYNIVMRNYLYGPLQLVCEIITLLDSGKLDKKNAKSVIIYYTEDEIHDRGLKKTDFKMTVKKLLNGEIESGLKKKYTASELDV